MSSRPIDFSENALAILKAEHHELLARFERILMLRSPKDVQHAWEALSQAVKRHIAVEAEVFFPAFLDATEDRLMHFVASVGHENIAAEMQDALHETATSANFASRVRALKKAFMHHVTDMEKDGGMFDVAARSNMDHEAVARRMLARCAPDVL
jgi:uncharacterized protein YceH (UPF0502 family)